MSDDDTPQVEPEQVESEEPESEELIEEGSTILKRPVEHDGRTYEKLEFLHPEITSMQATDRVRGEVAKSIAMVAAFADVPIPVIRKLHPRDFLEAAKVVSSFFGKTPEELGLVL